MAGVSFPFSTDPRIRRPDEVPDLREWTLQDAMIYIDGVPIRNLPEGNFYANVSWPDGRSYTGPIADGVLEGEGASVVIPPRDVYT